MKLNIKAYPEQIESKLNYGFKDIEIQLCRRVINEDTQIILNAIDKGADIHVIHSALVPTNAETSSSVSLKKMLYYKEMTEYIMDAFDIASICAKKLNHSVGVLIHNGFSDSDTLYFSDTIDAVIQKIAKIYDNYKKDTYILIENEIVLSKDINNNRSFQEKCSNLSQNFVINSFKKYKVDNVFTVVDTCHLMMDNTYQNRIFQTNNKIDWDKTFKEMKELNIPVGLLHLSRCESDGLGKDHGRPFDKNSQKELYEILEAREKYYPNSQITIEVYEENYFAEPLNYITEKILIDNWENIQGIVAFEVIASD